MSNNGVQKIAKQLAQSSNEIIQKACLFAKRNCEADTPDLVYIGSSVALSAIISITPWLAKRARGKTDVESMRNAVQSINRETLLFSALIASRMMNEDGVQDIRDADDHDLGPAMSAGISSSFGLDTLAYALRDWVKLTEKNPADYFEPALLEALRDEEVKIAERETGAQKQVEDFFRKKVVQFPSSKTLN